MRSSARRRIRSYPIKRHGENDVNDVNDENDEND